jgi:hypothetical protein
MREAVEEEDFSSSVFHCLPLQKDVDSFSKRHRHHPHLPKAFHVLEGRQHSGRPRLSLPCFLPIKTGKERAKKKEEKRRERAQERGKTKRKKKEEAEKRMKNREEREEKQTEPLPPPRTTGATTSAATCRLQHLRQRQQPLQVSPSPLPFSPASSLSCLHCSRNM